MLGYFEGLPREEVVKRRLQEGKEGYVPSQSDRTENTEVLRGCSIYAGPSHVRYIVGGQKK